jgi:ribonuclease BN (tRNA processing enzyme)
MIYMGKIIIKMYKASYGESFLISCVGKDSITNILVDMGFGSTYSSCLKNDLISLKNNGQLIDLIVFTHIDRDHILGGIKFLQENGCNDSPNIIKVNEVWHNTLRHLVPTNITECAIDESDYEILDSIKSIGIPDQGNAEREKYKPISDTEGTALGALILKGKYNWNSLFNGKSVSTDSCSKESININNEVKVKILSPSSIELKELNDYWIDKLRNNKNFKGEITSDSIFDDAFEFLIGQSYEKKLQKKYKLIGNTQDWSEVAIDEEEPHIEIPNKSSISFVLEFEHKKILFTGDADPKRLVDSLKYYYKECDKIKIDFDAIKVSHHGSLNNTDKKLLSIMDSNIYLISTSGALFNHPDLETIAKIVCRDRDKKEKRKLVFNYVDTANRFDNPEMKQKYKFEIIKPDKPDSIEIILGCD